MSTKSARQKGFQRYPGKWKMNNDVDEEDDWLRETTAENAARLEANPASRKRPRSDLQGEPL
jgi:hypothetical protein